MFIFLSANSANLSKALTIEPSFFLGIGEAWVANNRLHILNLIFNHTCANRMLSKALVRYNWPAMQVETIEDAREDSAHWSHYVGSAAAAQVKTVQTHFLSLRHQGETSLWKASIQHISASIFPLKRWSTADKDVGSALHGCDSPVGML